MTMRLETGIVQCGEDDWPGIFIRGDRAIFHAFTLERVLEAMDDELSEDVFLKLSLSSFAKLLGSCRVEGGVEPKDLQHVTRSRLPSAPYDEAEAEADLVQLGVAPDKAGELAKTMRFEQELWNNCGEAGAWAVKTIRKLENELDEQKLMLKIMKDAQ